MFADTRKTGKNPANPRESVFLRMKRNDFLPGILVSLGLIAAIETLASTAFNIPNAGVVVLLAVAYAAFTGGTRAGLASAVLVSIYIAWNFSIPGELFRYSAFNFNRLMVLLIVAPAMALLVGTLRRRSRLYEETAIANSTLQAQIAARKAVEESLLLAASVFENAQEGIIVTDAANNFVAVNPAFTLITGYAAPDVIGRNPRLLGSGRQDAAFYRAMWASLAETGHWHGEIWNRRKNGEIICEWLSVSALKNAEGKTIRHIGIFTDITELKKSREALQESKDRLRRSQAHADIGTWDWNIRTGDLYWSERIGPLFGYAEGELETTYENFLNAVHPEDRQFVVNSVDACVNAGAVYDIEHRIIWPDGAVRWVHERGDVVRAEDGTSLRMLGVVQDITGRKTIETALKESEEKYRAIKDHAGDSILIADLDGNLLDINRQGEHLLGYTKDEIVKIQVPQIHPPEELERVAAAFEAIGRGETAYYNDGYVLTRDGRKVPIDITANAIEYGGKKVALGIFRDMTAHKQAEKSLRESEARFRQLAEEERLAHTLKQRETLVKEVHHRVKNNLQAVAGLLMHETYDHPELQPLLQKAIAQVQLIAVIHGIQGAAKGREIPLCEMVPAIARVVESLTQSRIQIDVDIDMSRPAQICERESVPIALILNELLFNAVKHSPQDAQPGKIRVTISRDGNNVEVSIFNPGSLPPGFNFAAGIATGTGLDLVGSLMPRQGAKISIGGSIDGIETTLRLSPPVIDV